MTTCSGKILVKAFRFNPATDAAGRLEEYTVESSEPLSVMALLAKIHDLDPTFACRTSTCFKGKCGSCLVRVNGQDVLGCTTLVRPGETVVVEPHSRFKLLRDVAVDFTQPLPAEQDKAEEGQR
ncbi:ferredoxin [Thermosinus carboxydivorans Nor1]|uniref:Ferredoxin n=1 Tax=Thermosinus carboxydivorans Nor1 TaxID=401526 RepID=A1HQB5_9FIRM|nr:2Fe-2S iron-sulfur cluster-binding protein [Thermosinus carboxydivorans]EAX47722.1 ferredoxin [Thermosinus carboxydivorans Nor1]